MAIDDGGARVASMWRGVQRHPYYGEAGWTVEGVAHDRVEDVLRPAARAEDPHALARMLLGGRVLRVRKALVVEVVHEPRQPPAVDVGALPLGICPHRRLDGEHVLAERIARR